MGIESLNTNYSSQLVGKSTLMQGIIPFGFGNDALGELPMFDFQNPTDLTNFFDMLLMAQLSALSQNQNWNKNQPIITNKPGGLSSKNVFETALNVTLKFEGGYCNVKGDHGGATNKGVTQKTYNSWCKRNGKTPQDVKNITSDEIKDIYYKEYWVASGADKVSDPKMAIALFDTSVLHGIGGAKKLYKQSGGNYESFLQARKNRYNQIVAADPSQRKFYNGWMNRTNQLA